MSSIVDQVLRNDQARNVALCRYWARQYREWGFNPLPSRNDAKRPFVRYAEYWERSFPEEDFDAFAPENIQVMCGMHWGLVVLDVDGPAAMQWLKATRKDLPPTWAVSNNDEGYHLWYHIPTGFAGPLESCVIYDGEGKHSEVARKADRSLIVAPPSRHVDRKARYQFHGSKFHPANNMPPADAPDWLLDYKPPKIERPVQAIANPHMRARRYSGPGRYDWSQVMDAIPDKVSVAQYYGLRVAERYGSSAEWIPCYRDFEDRSPSASINRNTGFFIARGGGGELRLNFFALLVYLGGFVSVSDAINTLGAEFCG